MNRSKQMMVALVAVASAVCCQSAAQAGTREGGRFGQARAAQWRERMQEGAKELDLTEDQKAKLKAIYQPQMEKLREIWKDQSLTREQKLEKFKALRSEAEPKLKGILTPEQLEKWQRRQNQARERVENAKKEWNISDEQKAKLKVLMQPQMEKLRKLRQNNDLSAKEKMEQFKTMREEMLPKVKEVLTPEQYEKWEKTRGQVMGKARERWQQRKDQ